MNKCGFAGLLLSVFLSASGWPVVAQSGGNGFDGLRLPADDSVLIQTLVYDLQDGGGSGYVVNDVVLEEGVCWFAGRKFYKSEAAVYLLNGQACPVTVSSAFVGWFDKDAASSGTGSYKIIDIKELRSIERLAVSDHDVVCVGEREDGSRRLVEVHPAGSSAYRYKVLRSGNEEEVFMDVVKTRGRVVVLSRFNNPAHMMFYKHYFGLRYGDVVDFVGTNHSFNCYDTYGAVGMFGSFVGVDDVRLAATRHGEGVSVAYLPQGFEPGLQAAGALEPRAVSVHVPDCGSVRVDFDLGRKFGFDSLVDVYDSPLEVERVATVSVYGLLSK